MSARCTVCGADVAIDELHACGPAATVEPICVYVAAPLACAPTAARAATLLREAGHVVVSTWHDDPELAPRDPADEGERAAIANRCTDEVTESDVLLAITLSGTPRGTLFEAGVACGLSRPIVWLLREGVGVTVFDCHTSVSRVVVPTELPEEDALRAAIGEIRGGDA